MAHAHSHHHRDETIASVRVAVVTVSDTRTEQTDESGGLLRERLGEAGHEVTDYAVLPDEPSTVREHVLELLAQGRAQVVITTGGTGIGARDSTYEALEGLVDKRLDGFGELFRSRSWEQVGAAAMLSRAFAGTARGGVVVALPGSKKAVQLAVDELLLPELGHMAALGRREGREQQGEPPAGLAARAARLAEDLRWGAAHAPQRTAEPSVVAIYNRVRGAVLERAGEAALADIPRFAGGAEPSWGELAVLAGQLASVAAAGPGH